jgi:hypothetical protein
MRRLLFRFCGALALGVAWLAVPAEVGLGDGEAECFEFGDELAQAAVVVEPEAVVGTPQAWSSVICPELSGQRICG